MVQFIPARNTWSDVGENFASGLSQGYMNRSDEKALQNAMQGLGENATPRQVLDAIVGTKTYSQQSKQNLLKNYLGVAEFEELQAKNKTAREVSDLKKQQDEAKKQSEEKEKRGSSRALVEASDLEQDMKDKIYGQIEAGEVSLDAVKEITKSKKPKSNDFEKGLSKERVKQYIQAEKDITQSTRNLQDLDRIVELNEKLKGPIGYFKGILPTSKEGAELSALGFGVIEPIVKIFNPSGPIAQKKLEQLQKQYGISRFDTSASVEGKVKALKGYANRAKQLAQKRIDLFKKHEGNPPLGSLEELDKQGEVLVNEMIEEDPSEPKVYYSVKDGRPVKAKDLEQQEELIRRGLITDVNPNK